MKNLFLIFALLLSSKVGSDIAEAGVVRQTARVCIRNGFGANNATLTQATGEYGDNTLLYFQIPMNEWSEDPQTPNATLKKIPVLFRNENGTPAHISTSEVIQEVTGTDVHLTFSRRAGQSRIWVKLSPDLKTVKFIDLRLKGTDGAANNHIVCDF